MRLRRYQHDASDAVTLAWASGKLRPVIVMATGTGKTVVFVDIAHRLSQKHDKRVMIIAHREELLSQAADKIVRVTGVAPEIEMAGMRADDGSLLPSHMIVASIQTLVSNERFKRFDPSKFCLIVVDEAHHAVSESYRKALSHFSDAGVPILGVTATPSRLDGAGLGHVFDCAPYEYGIRAAIDDGFLVAPRQLFARVDVEFDSIKVVAGDFVAKELAIEMAHEKPLHEVAAACLEQCAGRQTLIFTSSVFHAERLAEILNRHQPESARWVSGKTDKDVRRAMKEDFANGKFQYLCNCDVATEGFDCPQIGAVVIARPTKSKTKYMQMVGRGTRPLPGVVDDVSDDPAARKAAIAASAKRDVLIIDMVGVSKRHSLIRTADILAGDAPEEVVKRAKAIQEDRGVQDAYVALDMAQKEIDEEKERQMALALKKSEEALRRRQRLMAKKNKTNFEVMDPFVERGLQKPELSEMERSTPPTPTQIAMLERYGVAAPKTRREAADLLTAAITRPSPKMRKLLKRYGYDPDQYSKAQAMQIVHEIRRNGWRKIRREALA